MEEFKPSEILSSLINQSGQRDNNLDIFKPIAHARKEGVQQQLKLEQVEKTDVLDINLLLKKQQASKNEEVQKPKIKEKYNVQEYKEQKEFKVQENVAYDEEAYANIMKSDILAIVEEADKKEISLLEAFQADEFILLQFPTLIPFEIPTEKSQQVEGDLLRELYNDKYDSAGYQLKQNYNKVVQETPNGIKLGKIVFNSQGGAKWLAAKEVFDITPGVCSNIDTLCVEIQDDHYSIVGPLKHRFVVKPNIDSLVQKM